MHQLWMQRSVTLKYSAVSWIVHKSDIIKPLCNRRDCVLRRGSIAGNSKHSLGVNDLENWSWS